MLKGYDENGMLQNVQVTEEGAVLTKIAGSGDEGLDVNIKNASELIPESEKETTLYSGVLTVGTSETTIGVDSKVSELSIANYSETANVSVSVDNKTYVIAPGLALDLPINKVVSIVGISASAANTKVQYVIKGFITNDGEVIKIYRPKWSEIGFEDTPQNVINAFNYAKSIIDNWDSSITDCSSKYYNNTDIVYMPTVDTSSVTNMNSMFYNAENLIKVDTLDTSSVTDMKEMFKNCKNLIDVPAFDASSNTSNLRYMFVSCPKLSNESLNNILATCISANNFISTKTLANIGLSSEQATTCATLSNWDAFVDAGWSSGY